MMIEHPHFLRGQKLVFLVVVLEEVLLRIRAPMPDGIQTDVSRDLSSIKVADETFSNIRG